MWVRVKLTKSDNTVQEFLMEATNLVEAKDTVAAANPGWLQMLLATAEPPAE